MQPGAAHDAPPPLHSYARPVAPDQRLNAPTADALPPLVRYTAPDPVQQQQAGGGAGAGLQAPVATKPYSWSLQQLKKARDHILAWVRAIADKGGLDIELKLQNMLTMPALRSAMLPTNGVMLRTLSADMITFPGCSAKHYLNAFELWLAWTTENDIPTFPIVGSLVVFFLLDQHDLTPLERQRTATLLDLYRYATAPAFVSVRGLPRELFDAPDMTDADWLGWHAYVEQSLVRLPEWRALVELCSAPVVFGGLAPRAAIMPALHGPMPSPPMAVAPGPACPVHVHAQQPPAARPPPQQRHPYAGPSVASVDPARRPSQDLAPALAPTQAPQQLPLVVSVQQRAKPSVAPNPASVAAVDPARRPSQDHAPILAPTQAPQQLPPVVSVQQRAGPSAVPISASVAAVDPARRPSQDLAPALAPTQAPQQLQPVVSVQQRAKPYAAPIPASVAPAPPAQPSQPVRPPAKKLRRSSKNVSVTQVPAPTLSLEDAAEAEFWVLAEQVDRAITDFAQAKVNAALSARAAAARFAQTGSATTPLTDPAAVLATIRASPWTNGPPSVVPPAEIVLKPAAPFGDYVPGPPGPPLRTLVGLSMSVKRDPLNVLRPFPSFPPPPCVVVATASPVEFSTAASATVQLTPRPFIAWPAALYPLDKSQRDKTWGYTHGLKEHIDAQVARRVAHMGVPVPVGDQRERARKEMLAIVLRDGFLQSKMAPLPEAAQPKAAHKARTRVRKAQRQAKRELGQEGGEKEVEVLELVGGDDEPEAVAADAARMDVDGDAPHETKVASTAGKVASGKLEKAKSPNTLASATPTPAAPPTARPVQQAPITATTRDPSPSAPPAPVAPPPVDATKSLQPSPAPATAPAAAAPPITAYPPRPSLANSTAVSAPIVPSARPRSNSHGVMRRRPSVSGPNVHPLLQVYTGVTPAMRQMMRGKASELRGVPSDPVALAVAATRLTSPALRSEAVLAGSARGSPRVNGAATLTAASPPLVPIPMKPVGDGEREGDAPATEQAQRMGTAKPPLPKGTSALGMTIESPAMSTVARESEPPSEPAQVERIAAHESSVSAPLQPKAAAMEEAAPSAQSPTPADLSVGSAPSIMSTLSSIASATATAVAAAARAILPAERATSADTTSSILSSVDSARAATPVATALPAAGPAIEATAPIALADAATAKSRKSRRCKICGSNGCQGRWRGSLCQRYSGGDAPVAGTSRSAPAQPTSAGATPAPLVPAKRLADAERRPHPLHSVRQDWLALSEPLMPFSVPVKRMRVLPPTGQA